MKSCSKKILIDMIKPKKNTMHLLCRLTPESKKQPGGLFFVCFCLIFRPFPGCCLQCFMQNWRLIKPKYAFPGTERARKWALHEHLFFYKGGFAVRVWL